MRLKNWRVAKLDKESARRIACENDIAFFLAMMLEVRGIADKKSIAELLAEDFTLSDPLSFVDMEEAAKRIWSAIEGGEKICVYGDYDADGVTSTALLYLYLENCGANVTYYIPDRHAEGYGMNGTAVKQLAADGVNLIVTVDNGISANAEIDLATSLGMDTVVTDHHQPPEVLPQAVALVDPHRVDCQGTFKDFAGVGVVFKLICALEGPNVDVEFILENYADLILIGTVGDVVALRGENRYLVKRGLKYTKNTNNLGIREILSLAKLTERPIGAYNIAFGVVPRINASGRLSTSDKLVELLTAEDTQKAQEIAAQVENENLRRKEIEQEILLQAEALLAREPDRMYRRVLIVEGKDWHPGVIGIVASKLLERYGKPTIVISMMNDVARGSGRSIEGFSLYESIKSCSSFLNRFGGHPLAAGFELKSANLDRFKEGINEFAKDFGAMPYVNLDIDCKLNPEALSVDLVNQLAPLEPFGKDNPEFTFGLYGMTICDLTFVGSEKNHLRLTLSRGSYKISAMKFFTTREEFSYSVGDEVDLAVKLSKSEFRGQESLTVIVEDIKMSALDNKMLLDEQRIFEALKRNEPVDKESLCAHIPSREDFSKVYRFLRVNAPLNMDVSVLFYRMREFGLSFCKLLVILDVMAECGLIELEIHADMYSINVRDVRGKVDLESTSVMKILRE